MIRNFYFRKIMTYSGNTSWKKAKRQHFTFKHLDVKTVKTAISAQGLYLTLSSGIILSGACSEGLSSS